MVLERPSIGVGWKVLGDDGAEIGKVKEVHEDHLVVRGGTLFKHDLYVPVTACASIGDETVTLDVASGAVDEAGWRFPPERGLGGQHRAPAGEGEPGMTTMTGAGYGAGGGVATAGPLAPGRGDAIADRLGGSGRAGLSPTGASATAPVTDDVERRGTPAEVDEADEADDTGDDTSGDTSEDTSTTGDEAARADAPPLT
jgi:hypothetical protein